MPRKTINDYVFYKFVCNDENIKCCYVGSTANFSDRKRCHIKNCNNSNLKEYNYKIYETIRANGGMENWKMVIIGEAKEISLTQSRILEQNYIDELKANMNMFRAYTNSKEYLKQYKLNNIDKIKAYNEANKERTKEYKKQYYLKKKEEKNNV